MSRKDDDAPRPGGLARNEGEPAFKTSPVTRRADKPKTEDAEQRPRRPTKPDPAPAHADAPELRGPRRPTPPTARRTGGVHTGEEEAKPSLLAGDGTM